MIGKKIRVCGQCRHGYVGKGGRCGSAECFERSTMSSTVKPSKPSSYGAKPAVLETSKASTLKAKAAEPTPQSSGRKPVVPKV